ncbi:hypothetical protein [Desulfovibrio sp. JC010]|uniref:hypothetical protein n=1 Tax=Desulfovibrio sp. JC010 TaxID=2593641 RepID=UPI0013D39DAF|nr:hypothetical protein [Desulfovibrio sp. JC010]NDV28488.1 hypothetical protein [Desulfovibrio sp. JC010]
MESAFRSEALFELSAARVFSSARIIPLFNLLRLRVSANILPSSNLHHTDITPDLQKQGAVATKMTPSVNASNTSL